MKNLKDKVIIVAGGAGGIGRAIVRLLLAQGAVVVVASRKNEATDQLIREVKKLSPQSTAYQGDLGQSQTWSGLVAFVQQKYQRIDGLVNCVGVLHPTCLQNLSSDEIESMVKANLLSVIFGTQAVLPLMRRQNEGHIITLGSLGGIVPMPFSSLYCATKHAVRGFCLSLSEELSDTGIDVSLLSLGPVNTKMLDAEARNDHSVIAFINRPLQPEAVAEILLSVLRCPRRELIVPRVTGVFSLLCNRAPELFRILYRILQQVGRIRLRSYRKEYCSSTPPFNLNWENSNVRTQ